MANFATSSGAAVTTWNYDGYRGFLTNKAYADGKGSLYTYTAAGRLNTRTWARGITTTYAYNGAGDLSTVSYSDSTAGITNGYDRLGLPTQSPLLIVLTALMQMTVESGHVAGQRHWHEVVHCRVVSAS